MVLSTHKKVTSVLALGLTAALLFGSTFAWQSLNQEALNYVKGGANPGGRLHDDFNNVSFETKDDGTPKYSTKTYNKDVYVENFTSAADDGVNIYARVRLDEYMEIGPGAGSADGHATSLVDEARLGDKTTWRTHKPDDNSTSNPFLQYWTWDMDGQTTYMPTFNKNKDSLAADINGTFGAAFADYVDYTDETKSTKTAYAIYDADENTNDELEYSDVTALINSGTIPVGAADAVRVSMETHAAKETLNAGVISMEQWLARDEDNKTGNFWVWDSDGWAYWASPIHPGTATGLLLDQIQRTASSIGTEGTEWYYGINVVAQFITADDLGSAEYKTGFYNEEKGKAPSEDALELLKTIGVDVDGSGATVLLMPEEEVLSAEVSDEYELREAMEQGGNVTLTDDIVLTSTVYVTMNTFVYLDGCDLTAAPDFEGQALFTVTDGAWLDFDDRGVVRAPADGYAVQVKDEGLLYIWDGTFIGGVGAIYADGGDAVIVDGTFYLLDDSSEQLLRQKSGSEIIVYGGSFYNFDPSNVNGVSFLGDGCAVKTEDVGDIIYTVVDAELLPGDDIGDGDDTDDANNDAAADGTSEDGASADGDAMVGDDVSDADDTDDDAAADGTSKDSAPADGDATAGDDVSDTDEAADAAPSTSTNVGAVSGISGKADVVEPTVPDTTDSDESTDGEASTADVIPAEA